MNASLQVDSRMLERALLIYNANRYESEAKIVNKAMRYVLPAAAKRVKDKTPGATAIRRELLSPGRNSKAATVGALSGRSRGQKVWDALANTRAAEIMAGRLRKKNKYAVFPQRGDADDIDIERITTFYDRTRRMVNARVRSANYLRAGFIPAFRKFDVPNPRVPGQNRFKFRSKGIKAQPSMSGIVEAFATNQRPGAFKIAPYAFKEAFRDIQRLFLRWAAEDVRRDALQAGFY